MGIEILNKNDQGIEEILDESDYFSDITNLIIPYSTMFKKSESSDIYSGEEIIPFNERDSEFKQILIYEFLNGS